MPTIAITAHKGGAGKTTVAVNVAAVMAASRRVLVVDSDPQGALAAALGRAEDKPSLYEVMIGKASAEQAIRATDVAQLDILAADLDLAAIEIQLPGRPRWQLALRQALAPVSDRYGLVLVDTAPGLGVLPLVALGAADGAVVVCPPDYLSFRALRGVLAMIDQVRQGTGLELLGIAPTLVSGRTRHEVDVLAGLQGKYGALLLPATPRRVVVADAAMAGEPLTSFAPGSDTAAAFTALAEEVVRRAQASKPG